MEAVIISHASCFPLWHESRAVDCLAYSWAQGWSLNPGRYVGVAERAADDFDFEERLTELNEELERLNAEARVLEERIAENVTELLEQIS